MVLMGKTDDASFRVKALVKTRGTLKLAQYYA